MEYSVTTNKWSRKKAESEEELKILLMKVKVESEKVGSKLNIQKMKVMASGPITSWEIDGETGETDGETVETASDFIFLGSKITADGDCIHEIKRRLLTGRKVTPCLFNFYAEYIMRNAGLEETQAGIKIAGRNINNLRYADDTTLLAQSEEEL